MLTAILLGGFSLKAQTNPTCPGDPFIEKQIAQRPTADAFNALGVYFTDHQYPNCSIAAFLRALAIDPHYWRASLNLGLAYLSEGQHARAVGQLRRVAEEEPAIPEIHGPSEPHWKLQERCRKHRRSSKQLLLWIPARLSRYFIAV